MGQFLSTDFVRQNSPGILRSRKLRCRIKLLGKARSLNLIKRKKKKKKPEEQNIWRHIWGRSDSFPRTDGSNGNTENGWLAKLLFCICLILSSSVQFIEAQQKCQQLFHVEGSHNYNKHRNNFSTYQHPIRSLCTYHLHFQIRAAVSDAAVGKTKSQSFPFTSWLIGVGHNIQINRSLANEYTV